MCLKIHYFKPLKWKCAVREHWINIYSILLYPQRLTINSNPGPFSIRLTYFGFILNIMLNTITKKYFLFCYITAGLILNMWVLLVRSIHSVQIGCVILELNTSDRSVNILEEYWKYWSKYWKYWSKYCNFF